MKFGTIFQKLRVKAHSQTEFSKKQDEEDKRISDLHQATHAICQAIGQMSELNQSTLQKLAQQIKELEVERRIFYNSAVSILDSILMLQYSHKQAINSIRHSSSAILASVGNIEAAIIAQNVTLIDVINSSIEIVDNTQHLSEILNAVSGISWTQDQINKQLQTLKDML